VNEIGENAQEGGFAATFFGGRQAKAGTAENAKHMEVRWKRSISWTKEFR
jgi:hypothetical protein